MRIDPVLNRNYRLFNRLYFKGKLPPARVGWGSKKELAVGKNQRMALGVTWQAKDGVFQIALNSKLAKLNWWGVLHATQLHEMVHVKTNLSDNHGPAFEREMIRLAKAGAFAKHTPRGSPRW